MDLGELRERESKWRDCSDNPRLREREREPIHCPHCQRQDRAEEINTKTVTILITSHISLSLNLGNPTNFEDPLTLLLRGILLFKLHNRCVCDLGRKSLSVSVFDLFV